MTDEEIQRLQEENAELRQEVEKLKNELIRLVSRNLDLSERLEEDLEMRRRTEVARELLNGNIERQRNADLKDDAQLAPERGLLACAKPKQVVAQYLSPFALALHLAIERLQQRGLSTAYGTHQIDHLACLYLKAYIG